MQSSSETILCVFYEEISDKVYIYYVGKIKKPIEIKLPKTQATTSVMIDKVDGKYFGYSCNPDATVQNVYIWSSLLPVDNDGVCCVKTVLQLKCETEENPVVHTQIKHTYPD